MSAIGQPSKESLRCNQLSRSRRAPGTVEIRVSGHALARISFRSEGERVMAGRMLSAAGQVLEEDACNR